MIINGQAVPSNWTKYPKSFLVAAIPIFHEEGGDFAKAWHTLAQRGITGLLKSNGCPVITEFEPVKKDATTVSYAYVIQANPHLDYFVTISIRDKEGKFLKSEVSPNLVNMAGEIKSPNGEVGSIKLSVKPVGVDGIIDTKIISFKQEQGKLF